MRSSGNSCSGSWRSPRCWPVPVAIPTFDDALAEEAAMRGVSAGRA